MKVRMSHYSKPTLIVEDFKNSIGQIIHPGDDVVIVTSGYNKRIHIRRGIYNGRKGINKGVSCTSFKRVNRYRFIDTKVDVKSEDWPSMDYSIGYNSPLYKEAYEKYHKEITIFNTKIEVYYVEVPFNTTLQSNRIFKIDTPVLDISI